MKKIIMKILYVIILILLITSNKIINHFSSESSKKEFTTGIKGQVFISPISKKIYTDENGKFKIALDAGKYTIIPETITKNGNYPIGENINITLKSGEIAFVEIDFDSGIR